MLFPWFGDTQRINFSINSNTFKINYFLPKLLEGYGIVSGFEEFVCERMSVDECPPHRETLVVRIELFGNAIFLVRLKREAPQGNDLFVSVDF